LSTTCMRMQDIAVIVPGRRRLGFEHTGFSETQ
jgi:hypothetical protein